jgi:phage terminase large subunit GpA-like protein
VPSGYVHLPDWAPDEELRQLVAERQVKETNRRGYTEQVWKKKPGDRNEALDCLVYAYAGACALGLWSAPAGWWARRAEAYGVAPEDPAPQVEAADATLTAIPAGASAPARARSRLAGLFTARSGRSDDPFVG